MAKQTRAQIGNRHAGNQTAQAGLAAGDVSALRFDYEQVASHDRVVVQGAALDILRRQRNISDDLIAIGRHFLTVKAILEHGLFVHWIEVEFGYRYRAAAEEMNIARRFEGKSAIIAHLNPTVMRLLAAPTVPDEAVKELVAYAKREKRAPSVRLTKAIVANYKRTLVVDVVDVVDVGPVDAASATIDGEYTIAKNSADPPPAYTYAGLEAEQAIQEKAHLVPGYLRNMAKIKYGDQYTGVVLRLSIIRKVRAAALRGILRDYLTGEETDALIIALTNALEREGQGGEKGDDE